MPHVDEGHLHAWIDGEVSGNDAERIDRHLANCDACSTLLEDIARIHARSGDLIADAQGASAPAWDEIVARAEDTTPPPVNEHTQRDDSDPSTSEQARGVWTPRLLTSGLAWAATLVLAFGLGWYAGLRPDEALRSNAELRSQVVPPATQEELDVVEPGSSAGDSNAERLVGAVQGAAEAEQENGLVRRTAADELAQDEPKRSVKVAGERSELAEKQAEAVAKPLVAVAGGRLDRDAAAPGRQAQTRAAPARERQRAVAAQDDAGVGMADAAASSPEWVYDGVENAPLDIAAWLGREPLRLAGAVLASTRVAPLATGPGEPSEPGAWMLFDDPQTGARVAVAQRRWPRGNDADQTALPTDADTAVLTVIRDGSRQLWWVTADGYLVLVTADVDEATLRDLAQRLR